MTDAMVDLLSVTQVPICVSVVDAVDLSQYARRDVS